MNRTAITFLTLLLLAGLSIVPLKAQIPHLVFHAELGGNEMLPPVNTQAKGLVTLLFSPDRKTVDVSGMIVHLDGALTSAKIRLGVTGQSGPVLLDLLPLISGRHILGQLPVPPQLLQSLLVNGVYAEVSTAAHPNGEMRGQFVCETDLDYGVTLSGDQAFPPNNSPAFGLGGIHFPLGSEDIVYAFTVRGLSGPITSAGIYDGPPSAAGNKIANVTGFFGSVIQGLVFLDTIDPDFLRKAREGKYYVAINTAAYPNGEIVGKIEHLGYFASLSPINGVQEVPPPSPPSTGFGFNHTRVNGTLDSLSTTIFINGIAPTSVKIRLAPPGQIGPEIVDMGISTMPGYYTKKYPITEQQLTEFVNGNFYINVTTTAHPDGELRGVMKNTLRKAYAFDLCYKQVVPPTNSGALGVAVASVDQANCYLNYKMIHDGITTPIIDAHFAQGDFGMVGLPFHAMNNTGPIIAGSHEIMSTLGPIIEAGGTYVSIGTTAYPNGEIRGQVRRSFTCPETLPVTEIDYVQQFFISPMPFKDYLNIELASDKGFEGRVVLRDLMGVTAMSRDMKIESGAQTLHLDAVGLPAGMYTLTLEAADKSSRVLAKKVIKMD